jgi:subtilisin family serine protease
MPRYIITHKRAGLHTISAHRASRKLLENAMKRIPSAMLREHIEPDHATGRRTIVIEAEHAEAAALQRRHLQGLLVEPEMRVRLHAGAATAPLHRFAEVEVTGEGEALNAARITMLYEDGSSINSLPPAFTRKAGAAQVKYAASIQPLFAIAEPDGGYWPMFHAEPGARVRFACPPLPLNMAPLGWWHREAGITRYEEALGRGIRIGIVGTGVGPHPRLRHVVLTDGKQDVERHETHVCGIIAARPEAKGEFAGIAPGAAVFSACIFHRGPGGASEAEHQGAIAHTIERLARAEKHEGYAIDLLNLSFGGPRPSRILKDALRFAFEQGTLCMSSAGNNNGGALDYPAAFPGTIAVTALGMKGWGPPGSTGTHWIPSQKSRFGKRGLYLAGMSSVGAGVGCAAPGNGIISTIPGSGRRAPYAAMDGTSLASPVACGVLAVLLSKDPGYLKLPRTEQRADRARKILRRHCVSVGLRRKFEGCGMPRVD